MKYDHDRMMQTRKTIALVGACSTSIEQVIAEVSTIGGTVFDVRLKEVEQQPVWRVKLLRNGERVKVYVDARSGHILDAKAEIAVYDTSRDEQSLEDGAFNRVR